MAANSEEKKTRWWWPFGSTENYEKKYNKLKKSKEDELKKSKDELEMDLKKNYIHKNVVNKEYVPLHVHQNLIEEKNKLQAQIHYQMKSMQMKGMHVFF